MTLKFLEKEYNKGKVYARKNNKKKENTKREINENQIFVSLFFKNWKEVEQPVRPWIDLAAGRKHKSVRPRNEWRHYEMAISFFFSFLFLDQHNQIDLSAFGSFPSKQFGWAIVYK